MAFEGFFDYPDDYDFDYTDDFFSNKIELTTLYRTKTKDEQNLSIKQIKCLIIGFKDNRGYDTQKFIKEHTYKECSNKIGYFINKWKIKKEIDDDDDDYYMDVYDCIVPNR